MKKKFKDRWFPSTKFALFALCGTSFIFIGIGLSIYAWYFMLLGILVWAVWCGIGVLITNKIWDPTWYRAMDEEAIAQGLTPWHKDKYK